MIDQDVAKMLLGCGQIEGSWATTVGTDYLTARFLGDTHLGSANQQFVSQAYLDLLQRPADSAGLAYWSGLLDSAQETAQQVATGIEQSPEYHQLVINELYGEDLGRSVDPAGLSSWTNFLAGGGTYHQLRAALLGSEEFFTHSGGTNSAFVAAVYVEVLGRPVDPAGAQTWSQALANGASRTAVAGAIIRSSEGNDTEVTGFYFWLLHRTPDSVGLQGFSQALANGVPTDTVVAVIMGSHEYAMTRA